MAPADLKERAQTNGEHSTAPVTSEALIFPRDLELPKRSLLETAAQPQEEDRGQTASPFRDDGGSVVRVPRLPLPPRPRERFLILQKWEGTVIAVGKDEFTAELRDLTLTSSADEQVTLAVDEIPESDRRLMVPGGVFYWAIGYKDTLWGQRERISTLRFRRLPAWTAGDLREIELKARQFEELIKRAASRRRD